VPLRVVSYGLNDRVSAPSAVLAWTMGFGEGMDGATALVSRLHKISGMAVLAIVPPFNAVAAKASNLTKGLDSLVNDAVHHVTDEMGEGLPVYLGGNSRGGGMAVIASRTGPCEAVGALSPLGLTSDVLGPPGIRRRAELGRRLLRTVRECSWDAAGRKVFQGAVGELGGIAFSSPAGYSRVNGALDYALSDDLQSQAHQNLIDLCADEVPAQVFGADWDSLFPYHEYAATLGAIGCGHLLESVPGFHACMEGVQGQAQLEVVGRWFGSMATSGPGAVALAA
jgi:hypothetical protein